jgi:hypothetical protein
MLFWSLFLGISLEAFPTTELLGAATQLTAAQVVSANNSDYTMSLENTRASHYGSVAINMKIKTRK